MDDSALKLGLLMESAQAHQQLAQTHLEKLRAHTDDLDEIVRGEIRRTLTEELEQLSSEIRGATQALQSMKNAASLRALLGSVSIAAASTVVPLMIAHLSMPSSADIEALRIRRDRLQVSITGLEKAGASADWRRCGSAARLCIRVEKGAPTYGNQGDYYVIKGY